MLLRRVIEEMTTSFCLDLGRQTVLGQRAGRAGIEKDTWHEIRLSVRAPETSVNVVLIETWPDARAELLRLGYAGDVGEKGMFRGAASTNASVGNSDAGQPSVLV